MIGRAVIFSVNRDSGHYIIHKTVDVGRQTVELDDGTKIHLSPFDFDVARNRGFHGVELVASAEWGMLRLTAEHWLRAPVVWDKEAAEAGSEVGKALGQ